MKTISQIPAAQYIRMSTEDQQYSIANQEAAIRTYAENHGYVVSSTYVDAGKSGVAIQHRLGLRQLIHDVMSGHAEFKAILVYDVSRWGRFQDVDEAAHYEFLCKSAGVPVCYCAEQFENNGTLASAMMKALKRTMAAEYSRELGIKVSAGQRRIALLGYRVVGDAGYGLRRMMVSPDGKRRVILKPGERKAIKTDRTILVPGPKKEVDCVRTMFKLAAGGDKGNLKNIAEELNRRRMRRWGGKHWDRFSVHNILTKEKYAGCNAYGKTTRALCSPSRKIDPKLWTTNMNAFVPLVSLETFKRAQRFVHRRSRIRSRSNEFYIRAMKRVLSRYGRLSERLLQRKGPFDRRNYQKRFGSIARAYELVGYKIPSGTAKSMQGHNRAMSLRDYLHSRLKELFPDTIRIIKVPGQNRPVVDIDGGPRVAVYLCQEVKATSARGHGWSLKIRLPERNMPILLGTMDGSRSTLLDFYVFPPFGPRFLKLRVLRQHHPWFLAGRKLSHLADFCKIAKEVSPCISQNASCIELDDLRIASDSWTITLDRKEIGLGPVTFGLLRRLVLDAGKAVTREQLSQCIPGKTIDPGHLNAHIYALRLKLGAEGRRRILRVPNIGYMYISPARIYLGTPHEQGCASNHPLAKSNRMDA